MKKIIYLLIILLVLSFSISYSDESLISGDDKEMISGEEMINEITKNGGIVSLEYSVDEQKTLDNVPTISCKSAYVVEPITGKVLYEKNAHEKMFPASTTKILTALLTMEKCQMTDKVTISQNAISQVPEGYTNAKLKAGEELSVKDLLYCLLLPSANEVAIALAEHISGSIEAFSELANSRAEELGCETLHFINPNGVHAKVSKFF